MFLIGIDPSTSYPAPGPGVQPPTFNVGVLGADSLGNIYRFVRSDATGLTAGFACIVNVNNVASMVTTTNAAPGTGSSRPVGVAMATVPANGFGWICVHGNAIPTRVLASCVLGTRLNTTATAGALDDDGGVGSREITGIALQVTNGGAAANVLAQIVWPYVGRTL